MHQWGEKDFDWGGLDDAINIIHGTCVRWGRLGGQAKEKFGQVRFYAGFGYLSLHNLIYPGYVYSQFRNWLWRIDISYIGPAMRFVFAKPWFWWQKMIYNYAYQKALKKHPHLRAEILWAADYPEFIKGAEEENRFLKSIEKLLEI